MYDTTHLDIPAEVTHKLFFDGISEVLQPQLLLPIQLLVLTTISDHQSEPFGL